MVNQKSLAEGENDFFDALEELELLIWEVKVGYDCIYKQSDNMAQ